MFPRSLRQICLRRYLIRLPVLGNSCNIQEFPQNYSINPCIEGCRTWVSDKTLIKLANALEIDVFRLLLPVGLSKEEIISTLYIDIAQDILKAKKDINTDLENILKKWGLF
jgi:hypothetical protein